MTNEVSPEQYKIQVLKRNFSQAITDLYDRIANLETELQVTRQQLQSLQQQPVEGTDDGAPAEGFEPPPVD